MGLQDRDYYQEKIDDIEMGGRDRKPSWFWIVLGLGVLGALIYWLL